MISETEIEVPIPTLHPGQRHILKNARRFNVISCGRRFGKTEMAKRLLLIGDDNGAINGYPVAYFCPTFKMLSEVWRGVNQMYQSIIKNKSEQEKRIEFITGGVIEYWSMENIDSVRGRKYKRVVIDEAAIVSGERLKMAWEQSIRPLLTDYEGDAWFLSTPKGKKHYYATLAGNHEKDPQRWAFFQMPTTANPYINPDEVESAKNELPPVVFAQEYLAEFTDMASDNLFIYAFDRKKHIPTVPYTYDKALPVYISVDFNVSPMTAIVVQMDLHQRFIRVIGEYRLMNSDVFALCDRIKQDYDTRFIYITGDSAGWNRSAGNRGHKSMYDIIQGQLNLNWTQIKTPRGKPSGYVAEKRQVTNSLLARHPDFTFSNCPFLIDDIENVDANESGQMDKSDLNRTHLLDCLCDFLYAQCRTSLKTLSSLKHQPNEIHS
jgi:hypothetical protein